MGYLNISWGDVFKGGIDLTRLTAPLARNAQLSHQNAYTLKVAKGKFASRS
jgi:hypothetical protein